jgi:tetratricopeptide (TPR) repeat protein
LRAPEDAGNAPAIAGQSALASALVVVAALLPYLNTLRNDFTFDDLPVIRENPALHGSLRELVTWVYDPGGYRPLTMLTYAANARLGESAFGFHLVNMALHALVSVVAFGLARRVLASEAGALAAALVFAVHPIHTEAVTSVVGRAELLAAFLSLVALLAAARAEGARHPARWKAASLASFAAALLAKESALAALPLIGVLYWHSAARPRLRVLAARLVPYALVASAYLGLRIAVVGSLGLPAPPHFVDNPLAYEPGPVRVRTALVILWQYISQLVLPLRLSADYSFAQIVPAFSPFDARFLIATALFAVLAAGLAVAARRAPVLIVAACFAALPLALTANLLFPIGTIRAERLLYMPSFGFCLACGWLVSRIPPARRRASAVLIGLLVALLGVRSWVRNRDWRDNLRLFTATVEASPNSSKAHYNLGVALRDAGRVDDAMLHYRRSFQIYPDATVAFSIGKLFDLERNREAALAWYERAADLDWSLGKAHTNLGVLHYEQGRLDSSEAALLTALRVEPEDVPARINLAIALFAQDRREEARFAIGEIEPAAIHDQAVLEHHAEAKRSLQEVRR